MKARINKILIPSIILGFAVMLMNVSMASAQQQAVPTTNNAQKMETQAQTIQKSVTAGENNMQTTPAQSEKTASTMMTNTSKMPMMSSHEIKAVQEALNHNGYKLATDGIMGKHTIAALKGFQKKNDLKVTGRPDTETLAKLKIS